MALHVAPSAVGPPELVLVVPELVELVVPELVELVVPELVAPVLVVPELVVPELVAPVLVELGELELVVPDEVLVVPPPAPPWHLVVSG